MPKDVAIAAAVTTLAGMSTVVGALIAFCVPIKYTIFLPMALAFSAGVMIYISFVEIMTEAELEFVGYLQRKNVQNIEFTAHLYTTITFFSGIIIGYIIDFIVHRLGFDEHKIYQISTKNYNGKSNEIKSDDVELIEKKPLSENPDGNTETNITGDTTTTTNDDEMNDGTVILEPITSTADLLGNEAGNDDRDDSSPGNDEVISYKEHSLSKISLVTALAIALHNFPEGIATFFATLSNPKLGFGLAIAIGIHNIPEGISITTPIYYNERTKCKAFWLAFVSGLFEPLGGIIGYLLINSIFGEKNELAIMLALCGGIMLYISFKELLPIARLQDSKDKYCTALVFLGFFVMDISILLFEA